MIVALSHLTYIYIYYNLSFMSIYLPTFSLLPSNLSKYYLLIDEKEVGISSMDLALKCL